MCQRTCPEYRSHHNSNAIKVSDAIRQGGSGQTLQSLSINIWFGSWMRWMGSTDYIYGILIIHSFVHLMTVLVVCARHFMEYDSALIIIDCYCRCCSPATDKINQNRLSPKKQKSLKLPIYQIVSILCFISYFILAFQIGNPKIPGSIPVEIVRFLQRASMTSGRTSQQENIYIVHFLMRDMRLYAFLINCMRVVSVLVWGNRFKPKRLT